MKKFAIAFAFAAVAALGVPHASAQQVQVQPAQAYGTAGCGLGSMIFGAKPGFVQIFAATTNGSFGSQTFGITSGTSNCVDAANPVVSVAAFVETNRPVLAKDIARGSGETIATLTTLAGCSDPQAVGRTLQQNFQAVFPSAAVTDKKVSAAVITVLRSEPTLACQKII